MSRPRSHAAHQCRRRAGRLRRLRPPAGQLPHPNRADVTRRVVLRNDPFRFPCCFLVVRASASTVDVPNMLRQRSAVFYRQKHLLALEGLDPPAISRLPDLAESYVLLNRSGKTQRDLLRGRTLINLFFEDSTRTRTSFELAGKRLGADSLNMSGSP